ncbi:MAG: penicillin-binding transpeptidase domain-containing protein [Peptococcaceae bacterium]|nr:penicillin-binding transpeptidase domain-containing protein [Peptococcaceae bacterium]MDH7525157.1 penicillin-binding transpeptidase domain-containing protein [Peptococcaceae bacterium]
MNKRIVYILGMVWALFFIVIVRMAYLQLYEGHNSGSALAARALRYRTQAMPGEEYYRGEILDCNLVSLTDSGIRPALVAFPSSIKSVGDTARELEKSVGIATSHTEAAIKRAQDTFGSRSPVVLKTNLTPEEVEKITAAQFEGIAVLPLKTRYGPAALASHLVGYLNKISEQQWQDLTKKRKTADSSSNLPTAYRLTDRIGVAGLEGKYEEVLRGSGPEMKIVGIADANGRLLQGLGYKIQEGTADPWRNHLVLTIDRRYQEIVERVMDRSLVRGAVVVLDIASGDVLAAASRPNFDQNQVGNYLKGRDELIDRTERVAFYPGSVFKMVTAAGVLEEGLLQPDEVFECTGTHDFADGTRIRCLGPHGRVDLKEAICKSCNTTFVGLGLRLGGAKLAEYASKLGFTVNINSQSPPALVGNASIGQQGVLVSPLQIANLYATIARGGYYRPWRVVSEIRNYQGEVIHQFPGSPPLQVISKKTCDFLVDALAAAAESGSGRPAWLEGKGTAGKTGTAQANDSQKVIAWFAGFTPLDNPRLAIAVMVEENAVGTSTGLRGGETAAPVFKEVAEGILSLAE